VIIDYVHNAAAMRALGQFVERLVTQLPLVQRTVDDLPVRVRPRRIAVVGTAGDRGNEELRTLGSTVAYHFDEVLIREDDNLRGRPPGELAALVAGGVLEAVESAVAGVASTQPGSDTGDQRAMRARTHLESRSMGVDMEIRQQGRSRPSTSRLVC
jgi:hypothetical protein